MHPAAVPRQQQAYLLHQASHATRRHPVQAPRGGRSGRAADGRRPDFGLCRQRPGAPFRHSRGAAGGSRSCRGTWCAAAPAVSAGGVSWDRWPAIVSSNAPHAAPVRASVPSWPATASTPSSTRPSRYAALSRSTPRPAATHYVSSSRRLSRFAMRASYGARRCGRCRLLSSAITPAFTQNISAGIGLLGARQRGARARRRHRASHRGGSRHGARSLSGARRLYARGRHHNLSLGAVGARPAAADRRHRGRALGPHQPSRGSHALAPLVSADAVGLRLAWSAPRHLVTGAQRHKRAEATLCRAASTTAQDVSANQ